MEPKNLRSELELLVGNIQSARDNTKAANRELVETLKYEEKGSKKL